MSLKNKKVLITAGPTWVPIDGVRVVSNIATGRTGIMLAEKLQRRGAKVTLLLGPAETCCLNKKIKLIRFWFFNELKDKVIKELTSKRYDVIIHNAAVSDFAPVQCRGKISSLKPISLKLEPLPKIITYIRRLAPGARLVLFKLESGVSDHTLMARARATQKKAGAEFIVANRLNPYRAFIIDRKGNAISARSKSELVKRLLKSINLTPNT